jgi:ubiquinone/menaquinone biosynthesis C-methylase UbiE
MEAKTHWEGIYSTKDPTSVSWFQEHAQLSLEFIQKTGVKKNAAIIDVGGGASTLAGDLIAEGYENVTVLDISGAALAFPQKRLGKTAGAVTWIEADITTANLLPDYYEVWHDRAVFHVLTDENSRAQYVAAVLRSVKKGGHVIISTFAADGPSHCSGLEVVRYDPGSLHDEFGKNFSLVENERESHKTPFGTEQKFIYCYCRRR